MEDRRSGAQSSIIDIPSSLYLLRFYLSNRQVFVVQVEPIARILAKDVA
jgi:hypothetical protein